MLFLKTQYSVDTEHSEPIQSRIDKMKTRTKLTIATVAIILLAIGVFSVIYYTSFSGQHKLEQREQEQLVAQQQRHQALENNRQYLRELEIARVENIKNQLRNGITDPNLKVAFLTFDDGPAEYTNWILDTLNNYGIKGTFFTNYNESEEAQNAMRRIVNEGHTLANHTASHNYGFYKNPQAFFSDVQKQEDWIRQVTGQEPIKVMRFPGGSNISNSECVNGIKQMGYDYYDWNASVGDGVSNPPPGDQAAALCISEVGNNQTPVILMHAERAVKASSRDALPQIIENLQSRGYEFMTLEPGYNVGSKFLKT